jgi:outer membrane protein OmpA-like peptidoglycan-associated protein
MKLPLYSLFQLKNYKIMIRHFTLVCAIFFIINTIDTFSQAPYTYPENCDTEINKSAQKTFEKAIKEKSIPAKKGLLATAISEEPDFAAAIYEMAYILVKQGEIKAAKSRLIEVDKLCPEYSPYIHYYLGSIYFGEKNYANAKKHLEKFIKYEKVKEDDYFDAQEMLKTTKTALGFTEKAVDFNPIAVMDVSTPLDEYLASLTPDNEFMYFIRKVQDPKHPAGYREIFTVAKYIGEGKYSKGEALPHPFNQRHNNGAASITADNKTMYFVICENNEFQNCDLWYSEYKNRSWSDIRNMGRIVNAMGHWDSQPTVSYDGNEIIFSSNRPGGFGNADLYSINKMSDGTWAAPKNLGPEINTPENEITPFLHSDSQTLYFSSKGHKGLGGYDIFYTRKGDDGKWSKPENLGYPINTESDEVSFFVSLDGKKGFYSSDRLKGPGGKDIFSFDMPEKARPQKIAFIKGTVKDENDNVIEGASIQVKNAKTKEVTEVKVSEEDGGYVAMVAADEEYLVTTQKEGYAFNSEYVTVKEPEIGKAVVIKFEIKEIEEGEAYRLNNIVYNTNSAELDHQAKVTIEAFAEFLKLNKKMKIAIHGHTDSVGDDYQNQLLSEERAESVYKYLISLGIGADRLSHKGFGETKPIASNNTEEGRAKNRRTEFVIISK